MPPTTGNNMNRDNNRGARARNGEGTSSVVHQGPNKPGLKISVGTVIMRLKVEVKAVMV